MLNKQALLINEKSCEQNQTVEQKYRKTAQRRIIAECIRLLDHPTADEIWTSVTGRFPGVSKTTVYRNMNRMVEEGQVRRLMTGDGCVRYDLNLHDHGHCQCVRCGAFFDVELPFLDELETRLRCDHSFQMTGCDIVFRGLCEKCGADASEDDTRLLSDSNDAARDHVLSF